ncbi:MAG: hypothetical protein ACM3TN_16695 [Alphaproteobacteria bacterium]
MIVAESPPKGGKYFYNPDGDVSEVLFVALMLRLGFTPTSKDEGPREFERRCWILVDATYEPVNALSDAPRDKVIVRDYPLLRADLKDLLSDRSVPMVLIKANVCRILEPKLMADGFNVINNRVVIPFPSHGQQKKFAELFSAVLKAAGIECEAA